MMSLLSFPGARFPCVPGLVALFLVTSAATLAQAQVAVEPTSGSGVVAVVSGVPITDAELAVRTQTRLQRLKNEEYTLKRQALDELLVERLLEAEAARRQMTVPDLLKREVFDTVPSPLDVEVRAIYDSARDRYAAQPEDRAFAQIRATLMGQRVQRRRTEFVRELKRTAQIDVRLQPPRMAIDASDSPAEGPATAAVTIVEFSDFECPYCAQLADTMKRIRTTYRGRIRFVYRHLPLPMHPNAKRAAEVATCADRQGLFWAMHDKMFESLRRVQAGDFNGMAGEAGVNVATLTTCLASSDVAKTWMADQKVAEGFGINGTPALFINGRMFTGAVPFDTLAEVIEDELTRATTASQ